MADDFVFFLYVIAEFLINVSKIDIGILPRVS